MPKENVELLAVQRQVQNLSNALTEQIFLRDVLLLINTTSNPYDRAIVEKLMNGTKLEDGDWAHIFGEAGKLQLPDSHAAVMQALYKRLSGKRETSAKSV